MVDLIIGVFTMVLGIYLASSTETFKYDDDGQIQTLQLSTFGVVVLCIGSMPLIAGISAILGSCKKNLCFLTIYVVVHTLGSLAVTIILLVYYLVYSIGNAVTQVPESMEVAKVSLICFCIYLWISDFFACAIMCHPDRKKAEWQKQFMLQQSSQNNYIMYTTNNQDQSQPLKPSNDSYDYRA